MDEAEIREHMKAIGQAIKSGDEDPPLKPVLKLVEGFLVNIARIASACK